MGDTSSNCNPLSIEKKYDEVDDDVQYANDDNIYIVWHNKNDEGYQKYETTDIVAANKKWNSLSDFQGAMIQQNKISQSHFDNDIWKTNIFNYALAVMEKNDKNYNAKQLSNAINVGRLLLQELVTEYKINVIDPNTLQTVKDKEESLGSGYQSDWVKLRYWNTKKINVALKKMNIVNNWHMNQKGYKNGVKYQLKIIQNELNIFKDIKHKNIMSSFGAYISDNGKSIIQVCELLDIKLVDFVKNDFKNWKNNKPNNYPPQSYQKAFSDLAYGIQMMHDNGYVHRDLHKWNILIRSNNNYNTFEFVLIDFGLTLKCEENQKFQKGSERHYSCESAGSDIYTVKSDVFSFGTILYEIMIGGENIFGDKIEYNDSIKLIQQYKMPDLNDIQCNDKYKEAIKGCWISEPLKRITAKQCAEILV